MVHVKQDSHSNYYFSYAMNPTDPTMEAETSPTAETEEISTPQ